MPKLNSQELREKIPADFELHNIKRHPIYIIVDNVLDTYNIGSFFRLADAVSAERIYLCGSSETPPNHKITKASVNTWQWVPWQYEKNINKIIKKLKAQGTQIVSIEQTPRSVDYRTAHYKFPIALVVGHETNGISPGVLKKSDLAVELPMHGVNKSLNVVIALSIVSYKILELASSTKMSPAAR